MAFCSYLHALYQSTFSAAFVPDGVTAVLRDAGGVRVRQLRQHPENAKHTVIYVHGSPGHAAAFKWQFSRANPGEVRVAFDRPGYGQSEDTDGKYWSIESQTNVLIAILEQENLGKRILVAHSYGGPVALLAAARRPDLVDGVVLLAPAIDSVIHTPVPFTYSVLNWCAWLPRRAMRRTAREILHLGGELSKCEKEFSNVQCRVHVIHGDKDESVAAIASDFLKRESKLPEGKLTIEILKGRRHLIQYEEPERVEKAVARLLEEA
jgi:pimeloyl-ACP methyl ester carboxylesterase